jgi:hypothetical protein
MQGYLDHRVRQGREVESVLAGEAPDHVENFINCPGHAGLDLASSLALGKTRF